MQPENLAKIVNNPLKAAVRTGMIQQILCALPEIIDQANAPQHIPVLTLPGEAWLFERQLQIASKMVPNLPKHKFAFYGVERDLNAALRSVMTCPDNGIVINDAFQDVLKYHIVQSTNGLWETTKVQRGGAIFAPIMWLDYQVPTSPDEIDYFIDNVLLNTYNGLVYYTLTLNSRKTPAFPELKHMFARQFDVASARDSREVLTTAIGSIIPRSIRKIFDVVYTGGIQGTSMLTLGYKVGLRRTSITPYITELRCTKAYQSTYRPYERARHKLAYLREQAA